MTEDSDRPTKAIPIVEPPQIVPSHVCLKCEVCCRFPEPDSSYRPFFTELEIQQAIALGIDASYFSNITGSQIKGIPHPYGEGYLCPAFDPATSHCRIYEVRPLDCQIYPFVLMWDQDRQGVHLAWDTKCPFLIDQRVPTNTAQEFGLPEALHRFAQTMAARIESQAMIQILSANSQLVMTFQDDVVVIQKLPRLTEELLSPLRSSLVKEDFKSQISDLK